MKKFCFIASLFLLVCAIFHKTILGAAIRYAVQKQSGCEVAYRSLAWEEGDLVFSDLIVFDPTFHVHIEKAYFHFDWKLLPKKLRGHLTIDRPRLSFLKIRSWPMEASNWLDLTVSVNDGIVEWEGLARFSYDQNHLALDWDNSGLDLFFSEEVIEAELKQFNVQLLNPLLPSGEILKGALTGRATVDNDHKLISANLKMEEVALRAPLASIEKTEGTFSYNADLGAKWELKGIGTAQSREVPFACQGRGFFKSRWIESEMQFDDSSCRISGEDVWTLQCKSLHSYQAMLLQAGVSLVWPELAGVTFAEGVLSGEASFSPTSWNLQFEGNDLLLCKEKLEIKCQKASGKLSQNGGEVFAIGTDYNLTIAGSFDHWQMKLHALSGDFAITGGWDGEKVPLQIQKGHIGAFDFTGSGWIDTQFDWRFNFGGDVTVMERKIPFHCSNLSKLGNGFAFDIRSERKTWDLLRLKGTCDGTDISFDEKSHLIGSTLQFGSCNLNTFDASVQLPWKSLLAADACFKEWGIDLSGIPYQPTTDLHISYKNGKTKLQAQSLEPRFVFSAEQGEENWKIRLDSELFLDAQLQKDGIAKGNAKWKTCETEFEGKITPALHCEFSLPKISFDLKEVSLYKMEGLVEGQGHVVYNGKFEADFDLTPSSLKINSLELENEGKIHLCYSSDRGAIFGGINIHGPFDCEVDLLQYDAHRSHWVFHGAHVHLPGSFLTHRFLQNLDKNRDLDFTADMDFASDFSSFACSMKEGLIPFDGASYPVEDLQLLWQNDTCVASCRYLNQLLRTTLHIEDQISGRLILGEEETPLAIDFDYDKSLNIHSIEGSFGGLETSLHADSPDTLIGSARVDFTAISRFLPKKLAEVFHDIKMGKGYELKGKLKLENNLPAFQGILSGKQLELFGFQFRTLLAQVNLNSSLVHIYDVKISDSAGMMKIDEILIEEKENNPWTIAIPNLSMHEFRPSLLQKVGAAPGTISPLVVRELKITDFKGLLDESSTYTANGQLHFINSYKREETVFDKPANVLNRIVGLDLELLIPVCGDLTFDLKNGAFHLLELTNAFSEADRSQFFLEMEPAPTMDLDGNLKIFIKMKQFVLLKITESFLISVDGQLDEPKYHLQKRRFFGLM